MNTLNAMKPHGAWEVRRRFVLVAALDATVADQLTGILAMIPGVLGTRIDQSSASIQVHYDITRTDFAALQYAIEAQGVHCSRGRWARWKAGWYQNMDLTGRENAGIRPAACCNKPPL